MTRKSLTGVICQLIFIIENGNTVLSIDRFNYYQLNQPKSRKVRPRFLESPAVTSSLS